MRAMRPVDGVAPGLPGTAVAEGRDVLHLQRDQLLQRGSPRLARLVLVNVLVHVAIMVPLLVMAGLPGPRLAGIVGLIVGLAAVQLGVRRWTRSTRLVARGYLAINLVAQILLVSLMVVTGGIYSPLLPGLAAAVVLPTLLLGTHPLGRRLTGILFGLVAIVACLPETITGPPITTWHHVAIALTMCSWALVMSRLLALQLTSANEAAEEVIDRLRQERVLEAEAQTGRLQQVGARVAHELKNPLAAIKGLVQLVSRGAADGEVERLGAVQARVERMEAVLREYLSFSRPLEELRSEPVDLAAIAADAVGVVTARAAAAGIALEPHTRAADVVADGRRLREAILNLLSNALEATPRGGTVTVETRAAAGGGGVIIVRDTGRGIRPEDLARLGSSTFTTRAHGTGLGVVLARAVVLQHGGTIEYASEPGHGTTVTIALPARPPEPPTSKATP